MFKDSQHSLIPVPFGLMYKSDPVKTCRSSVWRTISGSHHARKDLQHVSVHCRVQLKETAVHFCLTLNG